MKLVYSKGSKFYLSVFTSGDPTGALADGYVWVSDEDYQALRERTKCWEKGVLVDYTPTESDLAREAMKGKHK